jgi:hypothetical protein
LQLFLRTIQHKAKNKHVIHPQGNNLMTRQRSAVMAISFLSETFLKSKKKKKKEHHDL